MVTAAQGQSHAEEVPQRVDSDAELSPHAVAFDSRIVAGIVDPDPRDEALDV